MGFLTDLHHRVFSQQGQQPQPNPLEALAYNQAQPQPTANTVLGPVPLPQQQAPPHDPFAHLPPEVAKALMAAMSAQGGMQ